MVSQKRSAVWLKVAIQRLTQLLRCCRPANEQAAALAAAASSQYSAEQTCKQQSYLQHAPLRSLTTAIFHIKAAQHILVRSRLISLRSLQHLPPC